MKFFKTANASDKHEKGESSSRQAISRMASTFHNQDKPNFQHFEMPGKHASRVTGRDFFGHG